MLYTGTSMASDMTQGHYMIDHDRSGLMATTTVHPRHPHARHRIRPYLGPGRDQTRIACYAATTAADGAGGGGARRGGITHGLGGRAAPVGGGSGDGGSSPFEVVLVSWDENRDDLAAYAHHHGMKWLAVPHGARALADELTLRYDVTHIPTLVIVEVSKDGKEARVLSRDGRDDVERGYGAEWLDRVRGSKS